MKKLIVMMVMILVASAVTTVSAARHPFYNKVTWEKGMKGQLSGADQKSAFVALFSRTNEAEWWNNIPTCSYDQMRAIYSKHLMELYKLPEMPSDEAMLALVNRSQLVPAPATVNTAGIIVGTATVERFSRPAYPNEQMFVSEGIAWASGACGNLGGNILKGLAPIPAVDLDYSPTPVRPPVQFACEGCPGGNVQQNNNNSLDPNVLALIAAMQQRPAPAPASNNDDWMKQYMQMQMMKEMSQQAQPVVETRQRANFWEVTAGVTGMANLVLNGLDLAQGIKTNRLLQSQMWRQNQMTTYIPNNSFPTWRGNDQQPQYGGNWGRPRTPQRPNHDTGTWYDRRNPPLPDTDYQGGSGNYVIGNGWGYQNANAGLGVGAGYDYGYGNSRSNPLNDNGNGRAVDTRTGRDYTYNPNYVW